MKKKLLLFSTVILFAFNAHAVNQTVTVQNLFFMPFSFSVQLGDTITFSYVNGFHTTTSTSVPVGGVAWDQPIDGSNLSYVYVPAATGTYNYKCTYHEVQGMTGSFTVTCPAVTAHITAASATTFCKPATVTLNSTTTGNPTTFQWKKGANIISGATSSSYTANASATYKLIATNVCGSSKTSNGIVVTANPQPAATITPSGTVNLCSGTSQLLQANTGTGLNYSWIRNNVTVAGATSSSYTTNKGGSYKTVVTIAATGCSKTSKVTKIVIVTCRQDGTPLSEEDINVYPNPSGDQFTFSYPGMENGNYTFDIKDIAGKLISSEKVTQSEFTFGEKLKAGIYFVELKNGSEIISQHKVIKE